MPDPMFTSREEAFRHLDTLDIDDRSASVVIEWSCDNYDITSDDKASLERFLESRNLDNRAYALVGLIDCGGLAGYEADALLLYQHAKENDEFSAGNWASYNLMKLADAGSSVAARIVALLWRDDTQTMYSYNRYLPARITPTGATAKPPIAVRILPDIPAAMVRYRDGEPTDMRNIWGDVEVHYDASGAILGIVLPIETAHLRAAADFAAEHDLGFPRDLTGNFVA